VLDGVQPHIVETIVNHVSGHKTDCGKHLTQTVCATEIPKLCQSDLGFDQSASHADWKFKD
jgi:hypothetical protein